MTASEDSFGVSSCYVVKSRLQEYAQKYKLATPLYETIKQGLSHKPVFQSTVIVDDVRYDSLPGFFNRKAAEQSAAEVALQELAKCRLCKNLLQEYTQKMNYALPLYQCQKSEILGRAQHFTCIVDIGGIKYTGAATKTKKEAEISAALIAIQSESKIDLANYSTQLIVLPCEKKIVEVASPEKETIKTPKARKAQFKKKARKEKRRVVKDLEDSAMCKHCQNDQPENIVKTLNMEPSSCMNGFKEAAFASVETEASQA